MYKRPFVDRDDRVVPEELQSESQRLLRGPIAGRFALAILIATLALLCVGDNSNQQSAFALQPDLTGTEAEDDKRPAKEFPGSASLDSDTEIDRHLLQAESFIEKGLYEDAIKTWREILLKAGGVVSADSTWTHKTFEQQAYAHHATAAERIRLSVEDLPPKAFQLFRETVNADVTALLFASRGASQEQTLEDIVHRYFHTEQGDDVAFELAALRFDRGDFGAASRLLKMILEEYRYPSVSREQLLIRLAVANARMGDAKSAAELLAQAKNIPGRRIEPALMARIEAEILRSTRVFSAAGKPREQWRLSWGGPQRDGHMRPIPGWVAGSPLTESCAARAASAQFILVHSQRASSLRKHGRQLETVRLDADVAVVALERSRLLQGRRTTRLLRRE
jgi:tetratricopeptide (TPR) repeat protein